MKPVVSVVVANFNGERHLADALSSILAQTLTRIEVLFIDDASTDGSVGIAKAMARSDPRLLVVSLPSNVGPAAVRNHALRMARGAWLAVVDSDDIIHPDRLQRLVAAGDATGADIVADDMLIFQDDRRAPPRRLLHGALAAAPSWIGVKQYVRANRVFGRDVPLGYLKPLIRAATLSDLGVRYAEDLRIAEDYDLILRLLARGARFHLVPELLYFYRRHPGSISHRLSASATDAMVAADERFRIWLAEPETGTLRVELDARLGSIRTAAAVEAAIAALKSRKPAAALLVLARQPRAIPILLKLAAPASLLARLRRRRTSIPQSLDAQTHRPVICVLSRQRLTTGANGSSAYLISLCSALRAAGFSLRLICPSPGTMGRVPVLRIAGEGDVFDHVALRGTFRVAGMFVARDPRVFLRAALGITDRLARRLGVTWLSAMARRAPYAVATPWTIADSLFVAAEAGGNADVVLADYAFLTSGIPYVLRPRAMSAVVMHDLLSSRPEAFAALGARDSVASLATSDEAELLGRAKLVIAIQRDEAATVREMLPLSNTVVVAPMAVVPVAAPQPGEGGGLLFIGSGTAPNVDGLRWFLNDIWPRIRSIRNGSRLSVAGMVCTALSPAEWPAGVTPLGRVDDLSAIYRCADVVISPLRLGSGLKIKLVEALGQGKAVVATTVTAQGVRDLVRDAVAIADTSETFADEVLRLLAEPDLRRTRAAAALEVARESFSPVAAYAAVIGCLRAHDNKAAEAIRCAA